jgi:hypothetical protein
MTTFTFEAELILDTGENTLYSSSIDTQNGFAYFGTGTTPGRVVKINLTDFTASGGCKIEVYGGGRLGK